MVGKSCLIESALLNTPGVLKVSTSICGPKEIVQEVRKSVTKSYWSSHQATRRINFWFRLYTFGRSPVVVLKTYEPKNLVNLISAAEELHEDYGFKVIIDSVGEDNTWTRDGKFIDLNDMTRELIWSIPELKQVCRMLDETGLSDLAWKVFGGVPIYYFRFYYCDNDPFTNGNVRESILREIQYCLGNQISHYLNVVWQPRVRDFLAERYDPVSETIETDWTGKDAHLFYLVKPLFKSRDDGIYVPKSRAMALFLKHDMRRIPSTDELEELSRKE